MTRFRGLMGPPALSALLCLASTIVLGASVRRALELPAVSARGGSTARQVAAQPAGRWSLAEEDLEAAVDADPFHPERRRPGTPFRIAAGRGDATVGATGVVAPAPPVAVRLMGTVVSPTGSSFAMCQLGDAAPRVVRVGESIGELRLERIEQGVATFVAQDGARTELRVPKAGG